MNRLDVYTCDSRRFRTNKAKILSAIAMKPLTKHEIALEVGLNASTVTNYIYFLHQAGMVYIHSYDLNGGRPTKRFKFGCKDDAIYVAKKQQRYKPQKPVNLKTPRCDLAASWFHPSGVNHAMQPRL